MEDHGWILRLQLRKNQRTLGQSAMWPTVHSSLRLEHVDSETGTICFFSDVTRCYLSGVWTDVQTRFSWYLCIFSSLSSLWVQMFSETRLSHSKPDSDDPWYVYNVWHGGVTPRWLWHRCLFGTQRGGAAGVFPRVLPWCPARVQECWQGGSIQGNVRTVRMIPFVNLFSI